MKRLTSGEVNVQPAIIEASQLRKVYQRDERARHRFLDVIRPFRRKKRTYVERVALAGIDLSIRRGETVAVIGRNGAGKSTLSRLVAGAALPTSGQLQVRGKTKSLVSIGAGFHPRLAVRDNVLAHLACLGITGREAERLFVDVITFAELDDDFDTPFERLSTGRCARLLFSTATALSPEILVLDDVLSFADAYFIEKCRARTMLTNKRYGTTVLLFSGDGCTALRFCDRTIWLDRGQVELDGPSEDVIKAFESSIRAEQKSLFTIDGAAHSSTNRLQRETRENGSYGNGDVVINQVSVLNADEMETNLLVHGERCTFVLDYEIKKQNFCETPRIVVTFLKDGVRDVSRLLVDNVCLDGSRQSCGRARIDVPTLRLTDGKYVVSVLLAREGYYDKAQVGHSATVSNVYFCAHRMVEFVIEGSGPLVAGTMTTCEAEGQLQPFNHDLVQSMKDEHPTLYPLAQDVTEEIIAAIEGVNFECLFAHCPGLRGFDFATYLRCSLIRVLKVGAALQRRVPQGGRVLDYGSFFGNFALFLRQMGYQADAADSYESTVDALEGVLELLKKQSVSILDFDTLGYDLPGIPSEQYDAVICMAVIEHVPHTPREMLSTLDRLLKPGGLLILDTPNHAYLYNREKLARGESVHAPLAHQYESAIPFGGHHREYVPDEMKWMVEQLNHEQVELETFCYSIYANRSPSVSDVRAYNRMMKDPSAREIILTTSVKPRRMAAAA